MSLYSEWQENTKIERAEGHDEYWPEYFDLEKEFYIKLLERYGEPYSGTFAELAETFEMDDVRFTGFLDGINTSLKAALNMEKLKEDTPVTLDYDAEKLYYNMHAAKASWLYHLPQWDGILTAEKRAEIAKAQRQSSVYVKETVPGRNDPCPCGSGKKYKKCCGA